LYIQLRKLLKTPGIMTNVANKLHVGKIRKIEYNFQNILRTYLNIAIQIHFKEKSFFLKKIKLDMKGLRK